MDILHIFKSDHASACGSPMPHAWTLHTDRSVMESEGARYLQSYGSSTQSRNHSP